MVRISEKSSSDRWKKLSHSTFIQYITFFGGEYLCFYYTSGKQEEEVTIKTQVFLSLEKNLGVEISPNVTAYDRSVHDECVALLQTTIKWLLQIGRFMKLWQENPQPVHKC